MSEGTARRHPVKEQDTAYRDDYQRDRDRVLYSSAFRRLAGVAQVAAVNEQLVLHNRLTHSLKVAQMGRRLVQHLRYQLDDPKRGFPEGSHLNEDVVETAGLVHDIGHPPFGHIAEEVLDQRLAQIEGLEGFEGNAQSFRVVTKLARRKMEHPGLNLTQATLNAILKYPRLKSGDSPAALWTARGYGDKWGAYQTEKVDFDWAREGSRRDLRSANAVLMDWADDISYATHDLEDYFRAGLIPLHSLSVDKERILKHGLRRLKQQRGFDEFRFRNELETIIAEFGGRLHSQCWETRKNRVQMNKISSGHLTRFVKAVRLLGEPPYVEIEQGSQYRVAALKELTWFYVINRPPLAIQQEGQKRIIGSLFDRLMVCLEKSPNSPKIPIQLRGIYRDITHDDTAESMSESGKRAGCARAVTDYICLLTEAQAVDLGERLAGRSQSSMFGTWFN
ncbi:dGTPase [Amycolatopsis lurida]|uniref:dGTPase n=1 Tax=Amycolatopsis lurida NRRL 2430 TaxID=1460371 RepID=A0A2P2FG53_AMYLU|nr:dNTP triphosphohydrolase [Amycolatopsis lurida]KFU75710.1 dGTPase [Amycolatopsis lurida NRRL 2430]SEE63576.1 dGTPase [Amycolatopsis lurida]